MALFAETIPTANNLMFTRNAANRVWFLMMGRGLVHPVDLHHDDNLASHPELLDLLGDEFAKMNFDIKAFLRELALSQVYQRAFDLPSNPEHFAGLQPGFLFLSFHLKRKNHQQKEEQYVGDFHK